MDLAATPIPEIVRGPAPDEEIVRRVLAGDVDLFEVLMRRHNQRVYRAVRSVLRDGPEVEDAMQQAYLAAFAHLREFRGASRFSTWLVRIAVNEALARVRRQVRLVDLDELDSEPAMERSARGTEPERQAEDHEMIRWLERAVDELPEPYRVVFMLREIEGLDTAETAAALGVGEDVVKTRLHRAKRQLRAAMEARTEGAAREAFAFEAPRCDRVVAGVMAALRAGLH